MLKRKRTKESGSQAPAPERKLKRGSPVEQLRERSREGRKETNRKPSTETRKECMRNQAGKNGGSPESESQASAPEERSERGSPVEQLRERSREGRKETIRKPSTETRKECMRNQAGKNGENVRSESGRRALKKPL